MTATLLEGDSLEQLRALPDGCARLVIRRALGIDRDPRYLAAARDRIARLAAGTLPYRPLGKPVHVPCATHKVAQVPAEWKRGEETH